MPRMIPDVAIVVGAKPKPKKPFERPGLQSPPFSHSAPSPDPVGEDVLPGAPAGYGRTAPTAPSEPAGPEETESSPFDAVEKEKVAPDTGGAVFSQEQVGYCGPDNRCRTCDYMLPPNSCTYVLGHIEDEGYCILHSGNGPSSEAAEAPMGDVMPKDVSA